ncbi:hypothetical protein WR25_09755 [Diploscapter pachys]|uniref:Uncharacterized protein n=1 Tax=Diploscapter pachys TaxID=2018661 RepID=A0A2A2K3A5_9BILA|nr:hypothetical protein WR25_09755 [Diploscapter pachys]
MPTLPHFCFWIFIVVSVSATSPEHENIALSDSDIIKLSCLFFREDCPDHLTDLAAADRIFWRAVAPKDKEPKLNSVNLEIYMESQCPDTSRFMHKQMMPAWEKLSHTGRIDLTIIPFGKARCVEKGGDYEMRECTESPRGRKLLALSGSRTASLKPAVNFIPWIMIDGERNTDAIYDLTENLCKKLEPAPEECSVYVKKEEEQNQPV